MKRRLAAPLMLVLYLTGCYSWQTATISPWQPIEEEQPSALWVLTGGRQEQPSAVRVTLTDGRQLILDDPITHSDSIFGTYLERPAQVAVSSVSTVGVRHVSSGRTALLILTLVAALLTYAFVICGTFMDCN